MQTFLKPGLIDVVRTDSADIRGDFVRLDRNERVEPLTSAEEELLKSTVSPTDFISYPDPKPLQELMAAEAGLPTGYALLTNGSDAAIRRLMHACIAPGDTVLVPDPTYEMYAVYGRIFEATVVRLPYPPSRRLSLADYLAAIETSRPKMLCIANPDQPTGGRLPHGDLLCLVEECRKSGTLLLVDEAYWLPGERSAAEALVNSANLAVVRSFSKVYGFGGIRLGILLAQPGLIEAATKVKGLHEVSGVALAIGKCLVERRDFVERYQEQLKVGRALLRRFATHHNFGFPDCPSAFQLIELPPYLNSAGTAAALKQRGWLIRGGFKSPCMRNCLRISLAGPEIMGRFTEAFEGVLAEQQADPQ